MGELPTTKCWNGHFMVPMHPCQPNASEPVCSQQGSSAACLLIKIPRISGHHECLLPMLSAGTAGTFLGFYLASTWIVPLVGHSGETQQKIRLQAMSGQIQSHHWGAAHDNRQYNCSVNTNCNSGVDSSLRPTGPAHHRYGHWGLEWVGSVEWMLSLLRGRQPKETEDLSRRAVPGQRPGEKSLLAGFLLPW